MQIGFLTNFGPHYFFSQKDIQDLFGKHFKIIKTDKSKSPVMDSRPPGEWLDEYLMERI